MTDGQSVEIEAKPLNLVFQSPVDAAMRPPIQYPGRVRLDPEVTLYHARAVQKLDPDFWTAWGVFCSNTNPMTAITVSSADEIRKCGTAAIHLMGLIDLTLKLARLNKPVVWVYPETYCHPGWAVALADLSIWFSLNR